MLRIFIKFFLAILFFSKSLIILMMSLIHKIIFRISIGSRWCSVYLIAQKGGRNRVNILQFNWKTRGCHEQRPYVHRPRGNLCNYPFACSLLLFPSWTVPSHPIFARALTAPKSKFVRVSTAIHAIVRSLVWNLPRKRQRVLASVAQVAIESKWHELVRTRSTDWRCD